MAVEAIQFFLLGNPQADGFIDDFKNDNGHNHSENACLLYTSRCV